MSAVVGAARYTPHVGARAARVPANGARRAALEVMKFGGAALATGDAVRHAVALAAGRGPAPTVVVTSAIAGVTDALLAVADAAPTASAAQVAVDVERIRAMHLRVLDAVLDADRRRPLQEQVAESLQELDALLAAARAIGGLGPREMDRVLARGERLSARIFAAALEAAGVPAAFVDAADVVATDGRHGHAAPDAARTHERACEVLQPLLRRGIVPVVPGFIGRAPHGAVTTLGRGGSDLTATLLAAALGARRVVLWKDVAGLLTADPRAVPDARVIEQLNVREAAELAHYGARVLHARSLVPLASRAQLVVRSFLRPDDAGTIVSSRVVQTRSSVKAVAVTMDQALVSVEGRGLLVLPGVAARAFTALHAAGLPVALISQAATEYAIAFTVANGAVATAIDVLRAAFAEELARGDLAQVHARPGVAPVGVVGLGLGGEPRVAARVFTALAEADVRVLATAQSATGVGLSVVVDATRAVEAQRAIHDEFQLHQAGGGRVAAAARADVVLLGAGAIGRELLSQLADAGERSQAALRVCALVDRSGFVLEPRGFSRRQLAELGALKAAGGRLADAPGGRAGAAEWALAHIATHALARPILVDATAADTGPLIEGAMRRGWDVVLANKVPLATDQHTVDRLHAVAGEQGRQLLCEATVGAGLPVLDTLRKLVDAGDRVLRIEGCPSGTLGFLFGELGRGRAFSDALREAIAAGYAEPDPRIDLSGLDVARKALILARRLGFRGDLADVAVESLVPAPLRDVPLAEFLDRLPELDAPWEARVQAARTRARVLRYRVRVTRRSIAVGLVPVALSDPLGALRGTDNQFAFTTVRYRRQPLVITGPGAGPAVTAAGVYNDLLRIAAERR